MNKFLKTITVFLLCFMAIQAHSQNRPRSTADFTNGTPLSGQPVNPPDGGGGGGGATILPGNLTIGSYTNGAAYPLQLNVYLNHPVYANMELTGLVNGQVVAAAEFHDSTQSSSRNFLGLPSFVVPAGATFEIRLNNSSANVAMENGGVLLKTGTTAAQLGYLAGNLNYASFLNVTVTALANNANWSDTGIVFSDLTSVTGQPLQNCVKSQLFVLHLRSNTGFNSTRNYPVSTWTLDCEPS